MTKIAIINPRFEVSYWGMEYVMPIAGKQANLSVSALPLLAALTPEKHEVKLIDENVESLNYDELMEYDIIALTGMSVQRFRMKEILTELKERNKFVVIGGAWVTVQEDYFEPLADVIFVGEADETWPLFLEQWEQRNWRERYEQHAKTDMTTLPTPRFDLLKNDQYLFGSIQISRGCPFLCEFCDIIVTFGRRPRIKNIEQIIAELDALKAQKVGTVFFVDDNFIGNKKVVKALLEEIIVYQQNNGYPFRFFTEASLDLAEEDELMRLMADANITSVFIGIETPNEDSLKETGKSQNVRPKAGSLLDRVKKIQQSGMEVWCGMIVGFDNDDETIFDAQMNFLRQANIPHVMIGMLHAIPKTPLYARLAEAKRLDLSDTPEFGTNIIPLKISQESLRDGYKGMMRELYALEAYFARLEALYLHGGLGRDKLGRVKYWAQHPLKRIMQQSLNVIGGLLFYRRLMKVVDVPELREEYRTRVLRIIKATRDPSVIFSYIGKCAMHYHYYRLIQDLEDGTAINTL